MDYYYKGKICIYCLEFLSLCTLNELGSNWGGGVGYPCTLTGLNETKIFSFLLRSLITFEMLTKKKNLIFWSILEMAAKIGAKKPHIYEIYKYQ